MKLSERADMLISCVVDGEATADQWRELEAMALHEPLLWRELAEAQRDASALRAAMSSAGDVADRISLPDGTGHETMLTATAYSYPIRHPRLNRLGAWTGWLAAAMVAIVATVQYQSGGSRNVLTDTQPAQIGSSVIPVSSADYFDRYLQAGKQDGSVLGEVPGKMLVESRPAPSGQGFEIIYVRQVIERAVVPDLYRIEGTDDQGQATLARYRLPVRQTL